MAPTGAELKAAIVADMQNRGLDYLPIGTANPGGGFAGFSLWIGPFTLP